jgi:hypothetical protein
MPSAICLVAGASPFTGMAADASPITMLEPSKARTKAATFSLAITTPPFLFFCSHRHPNGYFHVRHVRKLKILLANINRRVCGQADRSNCAS